MRRLELPATCSQSKPSTIDLHPDGGHSEVRTHNILITGQVLCQLSYTTILVRQAGIEPAVFLMSGSYSPLQSPTMLTVPYWRLR